MSPSHNFTRGVSKRVISVYRSNFLVVRRNSAKALFITLTLADSRVRFLGVLAVEVEAGSGAAAGGSRSASCGERARLRFLRLLLRFLKT